MAQSLEEGGTAALEANPLHPRHGRNLPEEVRRALVADAALHDPRGIAETARHTVTHSPVLDRLGEDPSVREALREQRPPHRDDDEDEGERAITHAETQGRGAPNAATR